VHVHVDKLNALFILTIIKHQDHMREIQSGRDITRDDFWFKRLVYKGKYTNVTIQSELYYHTISCKQTLQCNKNTFS